MSNVRDFGAMGDGQFDDTEAIQHAVEDGDGQLRFPPGRYRISKTIEIKLDEVGYTSINGTDGLAQIVMSGPGPAFRFIGTHEGTGDPNSVKPNVWAKQRMPRIKDIAIEGDHKAADGIEMIKTMQSVFTGVHLRHLRHGIRLTERNRNVLIDHCHIYQNTGVGVFLDAVNLHQINITGNHISYNRLGGIRIERSEVRNLQITGNDIEYNNHKSHGTEPEPTGEIWIDTTAEKASVNEVTIASNTIQATPSPGGANIRIMEKKDESRPPGLINITGNVLGNQENTLHITGGYGISVTGNTIYSSENRNVLIEDSRLITLSGNVYRRHTPKLFTGVRLVNSQDCIIGDSGFYDEAEEGQTNGASLLELVDCRRINVSGCQFIDGTPYGIDVHNGDHINISGCTIVEWTRRKRTAKAAIRFTGSGGGNIVAGNIVAHQKREQRVLLENGANAMVANNIEDG